MKNLIPDFEEDSRPLSIQVEDTIKSIVLENVINEAHNNIYKPIKQIIYAIRQEICNRKIPPEFPLTNQSTLLKLTIVAK